MIIDLQGRSSYIDAISSGDAFMPQQMSTLANLTEAGKQVWHQTRQTFADVYNTVSRIADVKNYLRGTGHLRDDVSVYGLYSVNAILDAGTCMRNYVMAHPTMVEHYHRGLDVYDGYTLPVHHHVTYARAIDEIVQFDDDTDEEYIVHCWDYGFDDLHEPTNRDKTTLDFTYRYMKKNVMRELGAILIDELVED